MATAKFNVTGLTLNAQEAENVSQVIVEKAFKTGRLTDNYDIQTGISHDQRIVFLAKMGISGKALTACTPAEIASIVFTQKTWTPKLVAGRFTHCQNDENQLFKILKQASNVYPDWFDRTQSRELQLVTALILMSMEESIPAKAWFSDTAADLHSGAGVFSTGTDLALWNQFNGLWKQIFADSDVPVFTITENANATYVLQALPDNEGLNILKEVWLGADTRLRSHTDAKFYVTGEIYDNFYATVEDKEFGGGIVKTLLDGRQILSYRGIPVYKELIFDDVIERDQDDGTVFNIPHRCVLTIPQNIPFGTLSTSDLESLRSFYVEKDNASIIDFGYFLDAKFGETYLLSAAY